MRKIVEILTGKREDIIKGYEDIIKSKDEEIKNLEAENPRLNQSAENALRAKDEHREEIIDNYIKNTREEDKRIREEKADILNKK